MKPIAASSTTTSHNNLSKFGEPYPFRLVNRNKFTSGDKQSDYIYTFTNRFGFKYYANCVEYRIGVYAVKFHLKIHKEHPNRYRKLVNQFDAMPVIKTVIAIMLDILRRDELASFAFIGMPREQEELSTSKRYKVYREFCKRYFNPTSFDHYYDEENSFYALLNKKIDTSILNKQLSDLAKRELKDVAGYLPSVSLNRSVSKE